MSIWKKVFIPAFVLSLIGNVILLIDTAETRNRLHLGEEYAYSALPAYMSRVSHELDLAAQGQSVSEHLARARQETQFVAGTTIEINTLDTRINSSFLNLSLAANLGLPDLHSGSYSTNEMAAIRSADHKATLIAKDLNSLHAENDTAVRADMEKLRADWGAPK